MWGFLLSDEMFSNEIMVIVANFANIPKLIELHTLFIYLFLASPHCLQRSNPGPLQGSAVFTTGPPGKSELYTLKG